ncbi:MAG: hypothetical protein ACOCZ8_01690 [Bacteroidota bacterium]
MAKQDIPRYDKVQFDELLKEVNILLDTQYTNLKGKVGLATLHNHFEMDADEVLLEVHDNARRIMLTKVIPRSQEPANAIATLWDPAALNPILVKLCQLDDLNIDELFIDWSQGSDETVNKSDG